MRESAPLDGCLFPMPSVWLPSLRTRPPVGEEGEEIGCADGAVDVKRTAGIG